jgi:hypothetical protein
VNKEEQPPPPPERTTSLPVDRQPPPLPPRSPDLTPTNNQEETETEFENQRISTNDTEQLIPEMEKENRYIVFIGVTMVHNYCMWLVSD